MLFLLQRSSPTFRVQGLACCPRCRLRDRLWELQASRQRQSRFWSSSSSIRSVSTTTITTGYNHPPPITNSKRTLAYAHLTNRALIRLQGPDVVDFLNGLLPARLLQSPISSPQLLSEGARGDDQPSQSHPIFTAFLSAKGRVLYDVFVYPPAPNNDSAIEEESCWYVDADATSASALFSHLKKHKLRSKFKLEKVPPSSDLGVFYLWPSEERQQDREKLGLEGTRSIRGGQDPRPLMGTRMLLSVSRHSQILSKLKESGSSLSLQDYHVHRILCGHAEGPSELLPGSALPQESNIDFDEGIDFHKGCYLGQELTIRTHHTGVVRKRILPCQIYPRDQKTPNDQDVPIYDSSISVHQPPGEANIAKMHAKGRSGRSTGKWLSGVGNVGLALCRLETMTDIQLTAEGTTFDSDGEFAMTWEESEAGIDGKSVLREVRVKPFVPSWIRDKIQAGIQARVDRSKRRRQEDEDEEDEAD